MRSTSLLSLLSTFVSVVNGNFITPDYPALGGLNNYSLGSTLNVQWETALTTYGVEIWQQSLTEARALDLVNITTFNGNGAGSKTFAWTVQAYSANLQQSNRFFFWLGNGQQNGFTGAYFNIVPASSSSSTSTSAGPTASSSTSGGTNTGATSATATPTSSQSSNSGNSTTPSDDGSQGLSSSAKVGLGVGLAIGLPVIALLVALVFLMMRKKKSYAPQHPGIHEAHASSSIMTSSYNNYPTYAHTASSPSQYATVPHSSTQEMVDDKARHTLHELDASDPTIPKHR